MTGTGWRQRAGDVQVMTKRSSPYVKDVDRVVVKGNNAEMVWAGSTPAGGGLRPQYRDPPAGR